jgi:hypothetical protein
MDLATAVPAARHQYRRHGRHRVMLAAKLYSVHGESAAVLLDLSRGGALLNACPAPPSGCKVLLARLNLEAAATVVWSEGNRFGLEFDEPLDEALVEHLVSRPELTSAH